MPKKQVFPATLYVKVEKSDGGYFVADDNVNELVEMNETVTLAKYELVGVSQAKGIATFTQFKKRK